MKVIGPAPRSGVALALARENCSECKGLGIHSSHGLRHVTCACAYRSAFDGCMRRYQELVGDPACFVQVSQQRVISGGSAKVSYGNRKREYVADFEILARRSLSGEELNFLWTHFYGPGWRVSSARLKLTRGCYFAMLYRVKAKLGQSLLETRPYPLFPPSEYFQ